MKIETKYNFGERMYALSEIGIVSGHICGVRIFYEETGWDLETPGKPAINYAFSNTVFTTTRWFSEDQLFDSIQSLVDSCKVYEITNKKP